MSPIKEGGIADVRFTRAGRPIFPAPEPPLTRWRQQIVSNLGLTLAIMLGIVGGGLVVQAIPTTPSTNALPPTSVVAIVPLDATPVPSSTPFVAFPANTTPTPLFVVVLEATRTPFPTPNVNATATADARVDATRAAGPPPCDGAVPRGTPCIVPIPTRTPYPPTATPSLCDPAQMVSGELCISTGEPWIEPNPVIVEPTYPPSGGGHH